jgi:hypothetical protein
MHLPESSPLLAGWPGDGWVGLDQRLTMATCDRCPWRRQEGTITSVAIVVRRHDWQGAAWCVRSRAAATVGAQARIERLTRELRDARMAVRTACLPD